MTRIPTARTLRWLPVGLLALALGGISGPPAAAQGGVSPGLVSPPLAKDINPDPDIVEVILVVEESVHDFGTLPGVKVYTYNGSTPGPLIRAEVGNQLIVHVINRLPEDTTVHWHGMNLPADQDGSHISQFAIPPGGTWKYEFPLLRAALTWYHPHVRTNVQVENGLYGAILVTDPARDKRLGLPTTHHVLMMDDLLVNAQGQIKEPGSPDPLENADLQLNGREGNVLLVNGSDRVSSTARFQRGVPTRLHVVNVSNSRFARLSIPDHVMHRIGGDQGLLEHPLVLPPIAMVPDPGFPGQVRSDPDRDKGLLLTPGERADVVFVPDAATITFEWHDLARGRHRTFHHPNGSIGLGHDPKDGRAPPRVVLQVAAQGTRTSSWKPPQDLVTLTPLSATGAVPVTSMFGHGLPDRLGNVVFFAQMKNGKGLPMDKVLPVDAPMVDVGDVLLWEVHNLTGGIHNFHLHGFHFQVLETEFRDLDTPGNNFKVRPHYLEDKDTVRLPARPGLRLRSRSITRLLVHIDDTGRVGQIEAYGKIPRGGGSGGWLFHCHILEHAANGMMSYLQVIDR